MTACYRQGFHGMEREMRPLNFTEVFEIFPFSVVSEIIEIDEIKISLHVYETKMFYRLNTILKS
jgi:hypothetical protein